MLDFALLARLKDAVRAARRGLAAPRELYRCEFALDETRNLFFQLVDYKTAALLGRFALRQKIYCYDLGQRDNDFTLRVKITLRELRSQLQSFAQATLDRRVSFERDTVMGISAAPKFEASQVDLVVLMASGCRAFLRFQRRPGRALSTRPGFCFLDETRIDGKLAVRFLKLPVGGVEAALAQRATRLEDALNAPRVVRQADEVRGGRDFRDNRLEQSNNIRGNRDATAAEIREARASREVREVRQRVTEPSLIDKLAKIFQSDPVRPPVIGGNNFNINADPANMINAAFINNNNLTGNYSNNNNFSFGVGEAVNVRDLAANTDWGEQRFHPYQLQQQHQVQLKFNTKRLFGHFFVLSNGMPNFTPFALTPGWKNLRCLKQQLQANNGSEPRGLSERESVAPLPRAGREDATELWLGSSGRGFAADRFLPLEVERSSPWRVAEDNLQIGAVQSINTNLPTALAQGIFARAGTTGIGMGATTGAWDSRAPVFPGAVGFSASNNSNRGDFKDGSLLMLGERTSGGMRTPQNKFVTRNEFAQQVYFGPRRLFTLSFDALGELHWPASRRPLLYAC